LKQTVREVISFAGKLEHKKRKILWLRCCYGRETGPTLQENLDTVFDIFSILKPNAPLAKWLRTRGTWLKPYQAGSYCYSGKTRKEPE
jgi:hypothetical protein